MYDFDPSIDIDVLIQEVLNRQISLGKVSQIESKEYISQIEHSNKGKRFKKEKSFENLYREYESEKWSQSLNDFLSKKTSEISLASDLYFVDKSELTLRIGNNLYASNLKTARQIHIDTLAAVLESLVSVPSTLIEIGAGDGGTLLPLLDKTRQVFPDSIALDLSPSGLKKIELIANLLNYRVQTREFNLEKDTLLDLEINEFATVVTSFTLCCIPELNERFFNSIAEVNPRLVLHFEPLYEDLDPEDPLDMWARQYIEINDYNTNFLSELNSFLLSREDFEMKFKIDVSFGQNPLLPGSLICWGRTNK